MDNRNKPVSYWKALEHLCKDEPIMVTTNTARKYIEAFENETGIPIDLLYVGNHNHVMILRVLENDR